MKAYLLRFAFAWKILLALLLGIGGIILSGMLTSPAVKTYFPFIDVAILVFITWLLYRIENKSLDELGLNLKGRNLLFLPLGLLIGVAAFLLIFFTIGRISGEQWHINTDVNLKKLFYTLYLVLPSCAVQELMFRGYCFKKTIEVTNVVTANIIFALLFTLVHVLDEQVMKNLGQIIALAVFIPVGHIIFCNGIIAFKNHLFSYRHPLGK